MYCTYCLSENIGSETFESATGVSFLGTQEHVTDTLYTCHDCGDETHVCEELPATVDAERAARFNRIWRNREMPAHVRALVTACEDARPDDGPDPDERWDSRDSSLEVA
jgi:hypothetical protein